MSKWVQRTVTLPARRRGCHDVTQIIVDKLPELSSINVGILHVFMTHTSSGLTINENFDPSVKADMETALNRMVPENAHYQHSMEGPDDMPAHVKSSLMGVSLTIPIGQGNLTLGTWQGIYHVECRNHGGPRHVVCTINGSTK